MYIYSEDWLPNFFKFSYLNVTYIFLCDLHILFVTYISLCDLSTFLCCLLPVDVNHAGEGNMEIRIRDADQVVPNNVRQLSRGKFDVLYTPTDSGEHQANVTFNGQHVSGTHAFK